MFDRRTLIAIVIVALILFLLPTYMKLINPPPPPGQTPPATSNADTVRTPADTAAQAKPPAPAETEKVAIRAEPGTIAPETTAVVPDYVQIETPRFMMTIGSNGQVSSYVLKNYHTTSGEPVSLHLQARSGGTPVVGLLDFDFGVRSVSSLKGLRFTAARPRLTLQSGSDSVQLVTGDAGGQLITLTYVFDAARYGFDVDLQTRGLPITETGEFKVRWLGGVPSTEADPARDWQYAGAYAMVGDELEKLTANEARRDFTATGQSYFVAARSKYFIAGVIPHQPAVGVDLVARNNAPKDRHSPHYYDLTLRQPWEGNASGRWTVYWGPIKYDLLKDYRVGLEETMNWGWQIIKPFSKAVLWALVGLRSAIPNYGLVIIVFSVIVKVILWPLTRKSQISMKKMASLQPDIQALREKHKNNPQAMNAAIMGLYKERGVNPASGCIPLLLQMPLLYALFVIFSSTIEFRQAPFVAWITDLSVPDYVYHLPFSLPIYGAGVAVLPIIMGITQFFMSKRTTTDPNQKLMIYIMPVFMTVIFNSLPSGLALYYTLFNVLALLEQHLIKIPDFTPSVAVVEEKKARGKK